MTGAVEDEQRVRVQEQCRASGLTEDKYVTELTACGDNLPPAFFFARLSIKTNRPTMSTKWTRSASDRRGPRRLPVLIKAMKQGKTPDNKTALSFLDRCSDTLHKGSASRAAASAKTARRT